MSKKSRKRKKQQRRNSELTCPHRCTGCARNSTSIVWRWLPTAVALIVDYIENFEFPVF